MNKRITISLDESIESQLRHLQAKKISQESESVSFSKILTEVLKEGLKNYNQKIEIDVFKRYS